MATDTKSLYGMSEITKTLSLSPFLKSIRPLIEQQASWLKTFQPVINPFTESMSKIFNNPLMHTYKSLADITKPFMEQHVAISNMFSSFITQWHPSIFSTMRPTIDAMASFRDTLGSYNQSYFALINIKNQAYGLHFYVSDEKFLEKIKSTNGYILGGRVMEDNIISFYSEKSGTELMRLMNEWKKYDFIKHRTHIIQTCVEAIQKINIDMVGDLVIPTLFAQLEGLTKDFCAIIDPDSCNEKYSSLHKTLKKTTTLKNAPDYIVWDIYITLHYLFFFNIGIDFLNDKGKELTKATADQLQNYVLNRNGILHGSICNYGTKTELIRIVLSFDTMLKNMSRFLKYLQTEADKSKKQKRPENTK